MQTLNTTLRKNNNQCYSTASSFNDELHFDMTCLVRLNQKAKFLNRLSRQNSQSLWKANTDRTNTMETIQVCLQYACGTKRLSVQSKMHYIWAIECFGYVHIQLAIKKVCCIRKK